MADDLVIVDRLPPDMDPTRASRPVEVAAAARRNPGKWVLLDDECSTRKSAQGVAWRIRNGHRATFPDRAYDADVITSEDGVHQVWVRYIGGGGAA